VEQKHPYVSLENAYKHQPKQKKLIMVLSIIQAFHGFGWIKVFQKDMNNSMLCMNARQLV